MSRASTTGRPYGRPNSPPSLKPKAINYQKIVGANKPLLRTFLRCEPNALFFFTCEVYETERKMVKALHSWGVKGGARAAMLPTISRDAKGRVLPELGMVFLCLPNLEPYIIAHEMHHASFYWARHVGVNPMKERLGGSYRNNPEERTVAVMTYMMKQFYVKNEDIVFTVKGSVTTTRLPDVPMKLAA